MDLIFSHCQADDYIFSAQWIFIVWWGQGETDMVTDRAKISRQEETECLWIKPSTLVNTRTGSSWEPVPSCLKHQYRRVPLGLSIPLIDARMFFRARAVYTPTMQGPRIPLTWKQEMLFKLWWEDEVKPSLYLQKEKQKCQGNLFPALQVWCQKAAGLSEGANLQCLCIEAQQR